MLTLSTLINSLKSSWDAGSQIVAMNLQSFELDVVSSLCAFSKAVCDILQFLLIAVMTEGDRLQVTKTFQGQRLLWQALLKVMHSAHLMHSLQQCMVLQADRQKVVH